MTRKGVVNCSNLPEKWSPDDLKGLTNRIECAKIQPTGSLASVAEIVEILQFLHEIAPGFPIPQQRYFREAADELITSTISHLERLRPVF